MTPEMERDLTAERASDFKEPFALPLHESPACPFEFVHTDSRMQHAAQNPLRFAQCYVTLPDFLKSLESSGVIAVAPVHRSVEGSASPGEMYWYPFFSGYSPLQLPTRSPTKGGLLDSSLRVRWALTRRLRDRGYRTTEHLPIGRVFDSAEQGELTTTWERQARLVSVSDGQSTLQLLQWLILRRLLDCLPRDNSASTLDFTARGEWTYAAKSSSFFASLDGLHFAGMNLSAPPFGLSRSESGYERSATLEDDLQLLGLIDTEGRPSTRVECAIRWLRTRVGGSSPGNHDFDSHVVRWLAPAAPLFRDPDTGDLRLPVTTDGDVGALAWLVWLVLASGTGGLLLPTNRALADWEGLRSLRVADPGLLRGAIHDVLDERDPPSHYRAFCRLVPELHTLVRAGWTAPVRWLFLPTVALASPHGPARDSPSRITSGLVVLLEDDPDSQPYRAGSAEEVPPTHGGPIRDRLESILPVLSAISGIEAAFLQDQVTSRFIAWEENRSRFAQVSHFLSDVEPTLDSSDPSARRLLAVIHMLGATFQAQIAPPQPGARRHSVPLPVRQVAASAVEDYRLVFAHKGVDISLDSPTVPDDALIALTPYEETYDDDAMRADGGLIEHGVADLRFLLLDAFAQARRYTANRRLQCVLTALSADGHDAICLAIHSGQSTRIEWTMAQDIAALPQGRGLHNIFSSGISLGCIDCGIERIADYQSRLWFTFGRRTQ
jgi:hypothetical protein